MTYYTVPYAIKDWLFDESRKAGDKTVIEETSTHSYYVVAFNKRSRNEAITADLRVIMVEDGDANAIYEEWKNGDKSEDSFATLADKYTADKTVEGGLYEKVGKTTMQDEALVDWIFDASRKAGDTTVIEVEENLTYILYYVGQNDPEWKNSISNTLTTEAMNTYLEEVEGTVTIEDPNNHLKYIKIREKEEADAAAASAEAEAAAATEESASDNAEDSVAEESAE